MNGTDAVPTAGGTSAEPTAGRTGAEPSAGGTGAEPSAVDGADAEPATGARDLIPRVLLTGPPGCGKTTVVRRTVERLRAAGVEVVGFLTEEVRGAGGARIGFDVVAVPEGRRWPLARRHHPGPVRVGRYGVDPDALAQVLPLLARPADVVVVDEIGPMELRCRGFTDAIEALFARPQPLLATVHARPHAFSDRLRTRPDVEVIEVGPHTRDRLPDELAARFR